MINLTIFDPIALEVWHSTEENEHLIEGISAQALLLADRGYDTNEIVSSALEAGMKVVIPGKKNRKHSGEYDAYLYRIRHLVENAFLM